MKRIIPIAFFLLAILDLSAQLGGTNIYRFLDIPSSARVASLGGTQIAVRDGDLNLALYNPALLNDEMSNQVAFSYVSYFSDINFGFASYARHFDSIPATFAATIQFVDYGKFNETDATGLQTGTFNAGDYVLNLAGSYEIDTLFTLGVNTKLIYSNLAEYTSFGAAVDVAATYANDESGWTVAAIMKNIGYQFKTYTNDERENLAFQAQLGVTKKFKHAPFRLGIMINDVQKWDLTFDDPNAPISIDPVTGEVILEKNDGFGDKLLLHMVFNAEIIFSKNFNIRLGYNYRRRQELKINDRPGTAGLSWGLGMRIAKFHLSYGRATYHHVGASNHFTVSVKFAEFSKRNTKKE